MKPEDRIRLEKFRDQVFVPLLNTDPAKWPIRSGRIGHIILDLFSSEFFKDVEELRGRGMTIAQIGRLFHNPTRLWRMSHHLLRGLQMASFSLEEQRKHILTLLDMIRPLKYDGEFVHEGKNLLYSPFDLDRVKEQGLQKSKTNESHLVHNLAGLLWSYVETLYFVAHEISMEIHGPYDYDVRSAMVIRDYFNLRPLELWPDCKLIRCDSVRIICVYTDLQVEFDVYNNPYLRKGRYVDHLNAFRFEVDGRLADVSMISSLSDELSTVIKAVIQKVDQWELLEVGRKYADIFWYRKKPLCDALGKDWKPPQEVMKRFDTMEIAPDIVKPTEPAEVKRKIDLVND